MHGVTGVEASETLMVDELTAERLLADRVMATGTVVRYSVEEGRGLISPDEGDDALLVESTNVADEQLGTLTEGARVTFEVHMGREGLEAFNVVSAQAR
jgi:cold shock CspA family protein